jgi:predicted dehydrogenase
MIVKKYTCVLCGGAGKWGQNYIKTLSSFEDIKLIIANRNNWKILIDDNIPDFVIISTPPHSHIEIATYALEQDIPVIIEKPIALSFKEASALNEQARRPSLLKEFKSLILINHIHLFSQAFNNVKTSIGSKQITRIVSNGFNNSPDRDYSTAGASYSSLLDYGSHDISMILYLLNNSMPKSIETKEIQYHLYEINMDFNDCSTSCIVGNGKSPKTRTIDVFADGIHISYDDKEIQPNHTLPLTTMLQEFILCLEGKLPDRRFGLTLPLNVMKILDAAQKSLDTKEVVNI